MDIDQKYQQALDYLYSYVDFSLTRGFRYVPGQFDLGRMVRLMERLGNPHQDYPIIHVAGTKGKGSVSAMCASVLTSAGYRVGLYTSPHLQDYTERIQVGGQQISRQELVDLVDELKPSIEAVPGLTTFEITTALGFLFFTLREVNAAVVEVGLGGRLDATNVVHPLVSVITSLSLDHVLVLGSTLPEIAFEKAGIIKPGVPVVLAPQKEEARRVILNVAEERNAPCTQVGLDYLYAPERHSLQGQSLRVWRREGFPLQNGGGLHKNGVCLDLLSREVNPLHLDIPLLGLHQVENAAVAFAALETACRNGLHLDLQAIQAGFASVDWPGRFEILQKSPALVVDSAHNRDSAGRLRQALNDYFLGWPVTLILGVSEDKDVPGILEELLPGISQVVVTRSFHPRAMDPGQLAKLVEERGTPARVVEKVEDALVDALQQAGPDTVVLAAGSLFIAAAVRESWRQNSGLKKE